ncbi:MAG: glycosyl hydrolase, partial [Clostridiales bacterium]|nr:glycosyl hydrolase [Clostridiales bacterium]
MMLRHEDIIEKLSRRQKADLLTGKDFWSTVAHEELGLPSAYLSDGPHGMRRQADKSDHLGLNASIPATCFPTAATMANSWNETLGEELGKRLGAEAAAQDVNVVLGPGLNIKRNPLCGRNFEYFSEDPHLAGKMAAAYVRGIQSNGVSACIKHFAANNQELRRMVTDSVIDERALREIYLTGFEIAVKEGAPKAIMSSYNMINGEFANENIHTLKEILRDEWGFDGVVVTDWAGCNDRVKGLIAGNELEMPACRYGADDVYNALEDGTLDEALVDERLDNLIDLILTTDAAVKAAPKEWDIEEHHAFAEKCADECIVLLKNDGALPL